MSVFADWHFVCLYTGLAGGMFFYPAVIPGSSGFIETEQLIKYKKYDQTIGRQSRD